MILDGEAAPVGGLGIAKQPADELDDCPPSSCSPAVRTTWLARPTGHGPRRPFPIRFDPIRFGDAVVRSPHTPDAPYRDVLCRPYRCPGDVIEC